MNILTFISEYRLAAIALALTLALGLLAHHISRVDAAFSHAYYEYAIAADDADTAVYIPTATNNPIRQQINSSLRLILTGKMTDAERLAKAKEGLELLKGSQAQIDAISPKLDAMQTTISEMDKSVGAEDAVFQRGEPQKIIVLAKERAAAISDIRALSYRADFETEKIFKHFVDSAGKLTSAYIQELNNELPAEQDDFDKRQNRYSFLPGNFDQIQAANKDFTSIGHAIPGH